MSKNLGGFLKPLEIPLPTPLATNGLVKWLNRTLKAMLNKVVSKGGKD